MLASSFIITGIVINQTFIIESEKSAFKAPISVSKPEKLISKSPMKSNVNKSELSNQKSAL